MPKPSARPKSWLPKQIPKNGIRAASSLSSATWPSAAPGSPGPLEKKTPSGSRPDVREGHRRRHDVHLDAALGHPYGVMDLMPRSTATTRKRGSPSRRIRRTARRGDLVGQVAPVIDGWPAPGQQRGRIGLDAGDADPHGAALAEVPGQRAGVDLAHADDALRPQLVLQAAPGPPVGWHPGRVADDVAGHPDPARLVVLVVPAGVADVRRGGDHHLAVVAGVGQGFLVARHAGGEDRLAEGLPDRAERVAVERPAVFEHQQGRRAGRRAALESAASMTVLSCLTGQVLKGG